MRSVLVDITEVLAYPARSGIQRVVTTLIRLWRGNPEISWVRYERKVAGFVAVPDRVLQILSSYFSRAHESLDGLRLQVGLEIEAKRSLVLLHGNHVVFTPEVFYDGERIAFYHQIVSRSQAKTVFLVFDFLPWLQPDLLAITKGFYPASLPYLDLIKSATSRIYISNKTKDEFQERIVRCALPESDIVLSLGADGIDAPHQIFSSERKKLCCIGVFDGKKGQELVYEAFAQSSCALELHFVGKVPSSPARKYDDLLATTDQRVFISGDLDDDKMVSLMSDARASIFVSENEGFGLPALESLYVGIPVIVAASLPALRDGPDAGQIRLGTVNTSAISEAILAFADDTFAESMWTAAQSVKLPTWACFAEACVRHLRNL